MRFFLLMLGVISSSVVWGHGGHAIEQDFGGFVGGLLHPLGGIDHVLAAVGMGLWLGLRRFTIPLYSAALAAGFVLAVLGILAGDGVGGFEWILASTLIVTGFFLYSAPRLPQPLVATVISAVSGCHFYTHIVEMPRALHAASGPFYYTAGFFISTLAMIAAAAAIGAMTGRAAAWPRFAGAAIAAAGVTALGLA